MQHRKAFSATEVIVTIAILVLAIATFMIILPALGPARRSARPTRMWPQPREIVNGFSLFAQGNNGHYPGVQADGQTIDPVIGLTTQGRIQKLIEDSYISLDYARSPGEAQTGTTSFALLKVDANADGRTIADSMRNKEWRDTSNAKAVIISDRAVPIDGSYTRIKSIHTNPEKGSDWRGSVGWNDTHVTWESTYNFTTRYGAAGHAVDNIFATPSDPDNGDDALMVWHGTENL